jgi:hypothetical protein
MAAVDSAPAVPPADSARAATGSDSVRAVTPSDRSAGAGRAIRLPRRGGADKAQPDTVKVMPRPVPPFGEPRWVMLRSLVVPGWGQFYNRAWLKTGVIGGGEVATGLAILADVRAVRRLDARVVAARSGGDPEAENLAVEDYNQRLSRLVSREWLFGGLIVYALVDAYVDAHFRDFKLEFERDPALPGGTPASSEMRLSVRWTY